MKMKLLALVILGCSWMAIPGSARPGPALASLPAVERVPNATTPNSYPRWLPWVNVDPAIMSGNTVASLDTQYISIGIDSKNILHQLDTDAISYVSLNGGSVANVPVGSAIDVTYKNTCFPQRMANGWSMPVVLDTTQNTWTSGVPPTQLVATPDICVDSADNIHAVWVHSWAAYSTTVGTTTTNYPARSEIWYTKSGPGGWSTAITFPGITPSVLTPHPDPTQKGFQYFSPRIKVGTDGIVRIVCLQLDQTVAPDQYGRSLGNMKLAYITINNGAVTLGTIPGAQWTDGAILPRMTLDAQNNPNIVYTATYVDQSNPPQYGYYCQAYLSKAGAAGTGIGGTASLQGVSYVAHDVTMDVQGNIHYVWTSQASNSISLTNTGIGVPVQGGLWHASTNLPATLIGTGVGSAGVITDSRSQVHVLWKVGGDLYYGARIANPGPGLNATWDTQTPGLPAPSSAVQDPLVYSLAISKNDQIHMAGGRHYTKTMDYNLGHAGGSSMTGLFPGGALNVTSGNVCFELPLFSSKSTGYSITPSLIYNSLDPTLYDIAPGWRFNFEMMVTDHMMALNTADDQATLNLADGRSIHFQYDPAHGYLVADPEFNFPAKLERPYGPRSIIQVTMKSGEVYSFDPNGHLQYAVDLLGNQLSVSLLQDNNNPFWETVNGFGTFLAGSGGGWSAGITFETSGVQPRPTIISDPYNNQYVLAYTGNQLSSVTFKGVTPSPVYTFGYGASNNPSTQERVEVLKTITLPRQQAYTLKYQPDGRFAEVDDPSEVYLLDGDADTTAPTAHTAVSTVAYTEPRPASGSRLLMMTDRRGNNTRFWAESRRSLVTEIDDAAVLAKTANISPVIRTYDTFGNVTDIQDRWGQHTSYVYEQKSTPEYVHDNLLSVSQPHVGGGQDQVESFTYTADGLSNIATQTTYATPANGSGPVSRTTTYSYNSYSQVIQVQYPDTQLPDGTWQTNVSKTFAYAGPNLQLSRATDEEGHETNHAQWDPVTGLPGLITREGGDQGITISYDALGHIVQQLDPQGAAVNDSPRPTTVVLDGLYRPQTVTDASGQVTSYSYDADSNLTSVTPPAGAATTSTFDLKGNASGGTTPDGTWARFVDANGDERRTRDFRGFESNISLDFARRVTERRLPAASTVTDGTGGGGAAIEKTQYIYDQKDTTGYFMQQTAVGNTANRVTKIYYDERHRVKQVNEPDGATQRQTFYDEQGHIIASQVTFNGALQTCRVHLLDARDRIAQTTIQDAPYGGTAQHHSTVMQFHNRTNHVVQTVDPLGSPTGGGYAHKTTFVLDARDRISAIIDGKGIMIRRQIYGDDDRITQIQLPDPSTKSTTLIPMRNIAWTSRKELKSNLDAQGHGTSYTYNLIPGQINTTTDALGRVKQTLYHATIQRPITEIYGLSTPDESRVQKTWSSGLVSQVSVWNPVTQAYDSTHSYYYDQANRLEKYAPPTVAQTTQIALEQYFFNEFGEPNKQVTGTKTVTHTYDPLGQVVASSWSGAFNANITRTYNGVGLQTSVSDGTHQKSMDYVLWQGVPQNETFTVGGANWKIQTHGIDVAGNYTSLIDAEGKLHSWPVDENNRPTDTQYNNQGVKSITYTPGGLVDTETTKDASGNPIAVTTHYYDSLGRRTTSRTVKSSTGEVLTEYGWDYDAANQIIGHHLVHLSADFSVVNDNLGRVSTEATPGNTNGTQAPAFTNPAFGPLPTGNESAPSSDAQGTPHVLLPIAARSASYTYQADGNRSGATINGAAVTYTYNAANQLISESSAAKTVNHTYDQWGNESQRVTTQGTTTITENYSYNHLNVMSGYTNSQTGANWQYAVWPEGERYSKTNLTAGTSELYVPRFGDVATEYTQTGSSTPALENTYVQGLGIDTKNSRISSANVRRHYLGNQIGTLGMSVDDTGSTVDTSVRDSWGVQLAGATSERYGAIAQRETDAESGLVYMRHRVYDPSLGRFTQMDPLVANRPTEHYAYAHSSPISWTDPQGLDPEGHHIIPQHLWEDLTDWKDERVLELFKKETVGAGLQGHNSTMHGVYNTLVDELTVDFLKNKKHLTSLTQLDKEGAEELIRLVRSNKAASEFIRGVEVTLKKVAREMGGVNDAVKASALYRKYLIKELGTAGRATNYLAKFVEYGRRIPTARIAFAIIAGGSLLKEAIAEASVDKAAQAGLQMAKAYVGVDVVEDAFTWGGELFGGLADDAWNAYKGRDLYQDLLDSSKSPNTATPYVPAPEPSGIDPQTQDRANHPYDKIFDVYEHWVHAQKRANEFKHRYVDEDQDQ